MPMSVVSQMLPSGAAFYYSAAWRLLVETHMGWLRTQTVSESVVIDHQLAYKYEGDLYGALTELGIPDYMHWTIMRLNGLTSPVEFKGEAAVLMVPQRSTFNSLKAMAETKQRKIT